MKWLIFLTLTACGTQQTTTQGPLYTYRADMQVSFDQGQTVYDGVTSARITTGNLPVTFISPVNIDRVQITTCGRQAICQSGGSCDANFAISRNWIGSVQNTFTYNYTPTPDEALGMCPMYIEAYSKKDLTSWAFVGFYGNETLPAQIYCNGKFVPTKGLTVCQTKNGLNQKIVFSTAVKAEGEKSCNLTTTDNMNFTLTPDLGFCRASFLDNNKNWHRLIMLGYDSVLVRVN